MSSVHGRRARLPVNSSEIESRLQEISSFSDSRSGFPIELAVDASMNADADPFGGAVTADSHSIQTISHIRIDPIEGARHGDTLRSRVVRLERCKE